MRRLGKKDNLLDLSGGLKQYKGFVVADIDAVDGHGRASPTAVVLGPVKRPAT